MSVESQILKQIDHLGAYKFTIIAAVSPREKLWDMVDLAQDEPYENALIGSTIVTVDNRLDDVDFGQTISQWFTLHDSYFANVADIDGVVDVATWLASIRTRVPQYFVDFYEDRYNRRINTILTFPRHDLVLGDFEAGIAFTDGDALEDSEAGPGVVDVHVVSAIAGVDLEMTATLVREDATTVAIAVTVPASSPEGTKIEAVGAATLTASHDADVDAGVVDVDAVTSFALNQKVLITDNTVSPVVQEIAIVIAVGVSTVTLGRVPLDTSTPVAGLRNDYATTAQVIPLFTDLTNVVQSGTGTLHDRVEYRFGPDRDQDILVV